MSDTATCRTCRRRHPFWVDTAGRKRGTPERRYMEAHRCPCGQGWCDGSGFPPRGEPNDD